MLSSRFLRCLAIASAAVVVAACGNSPSAGGDYPSRPMTIIVPTAPGGGWDMVGRSAQQVLRDGKLVDVNVEVVNREGGGGATGLAELMKSGAGDPHQLMISGLASIGTLLQADSSMKLSDATIIATLVSETEAFAVPADSPLDSVEDLVQTLQQDPGSLTFGGGAVGNSDHLAVGVLLDALDVDPADLNYIGYSGGGETVTGLLSGDIDVAVSGAAEFQGQAEAGKIRVLAVTSDQEVLVNGAKVPSLTESGVDAEFVNWRAIFAGPDLSDDDIEAVTDLVDQIHDSPQWAEILDKNGWTDDYRTGAEARDFLMAEEERVAHLIEELS